MASGKAAILWLRKKMNAEISRLQIVTIIVAELFAVLDEFRNGCSRFVKNIDNLSEVSWLIAELI